MEWDEKYIYICLSTTDVCKILFGENMTKHTGCTHTYTLPHTYVCEYIYTCIYVHMYNVSVHSYWEKYVAHTKMQTVITSRW